MKKLIVCILIAGLILCNTAFAEGAKPACGAYCVAEQRTGKAVSGVNEQQQMFPAGLTKLMSFLLFFEALETGSVSTDAEVSVSQNAASKGGTSVFLDAGASYAFAELLQAAVVSSGNDATVALAEHLTGSEEAFTEKMNERAGELGLGCSFADPTGLSAETRASAEDLAVIAAKLAEHPEFFKYSTIWTYKFIHDSGRETELTSANKLIKSETYDGMTTGSAKEAGYCLAASMEQNGSRFLCIVLDAETSDDRFLLASELLSTAAASYTSHEIVRKGAKVKSVEISGAREKEIPLYAAEDLSLLLEKDIEIQKSINLREKLSAPLAAGEKAGELIVTASDGGKYVVELVVGEDIAENSFGSSLSKVLSIWLVRTAEHNTL